MKKRYLCNICNTSFSRPSLFMLDRQNHISKGELFNEELSERHLRQETLAE